MPPDDLLRVTGSPQKRPVLFTLVRLALTRQLGVVCTMAQRSLLQWWCLTLGANPTWVACKLDFSNARVFATRRGTFRCWCCSCLQPMGCRHISRVWGLNAQKNENPGFVGTARDARERRGCIPRFPWTVSEPNARLTSLQSSHRRSPSSLGRCRGRASPRHPCRGGGVRTMIEFAGTWRVWSSCDCLQ